MLKNSLLTNKKRVKCHICNDAQFDVCLDVEEDTSHTLRNHVEAKMVWNEVVTLTNQHELFSQDLKTWHIRNLRCTTKNTNVIFSIQCWFLLQCRNYRIFYDKYT